MTRISTSESWNSALLDLMSAQKRQLDAQKQVTDQKVATDLKGFGRGSETLTAFRAMQSRVNGYVEVGESVASRLTSQDLALNRTADAAAGARQAIAEALATGRVDGLMLDLQSRFQEAQDGLNAKHHGRFLFGGAQVETRPLVADTLADLTAAASIEDLFVNDELKTASRLDDSTTIQTGFLADALGRDLTTAFRSVQAFHEGASGPFTGQLTEAQRTFLEGAVKAFDAAHAGLVEQAARNGSLQNRVDTHLESQKAQADALEGLIGERTNVDLAEALSRLQQAQTAVQASAQVLAQLRNVSLLDLLQR